VGADSEDGGESPEEAAMDAIDPVLWGVGLDTSPGPGTATCPPHCYHLKGDSECREYGYDKKLVNVCCRCGERRRAS
jgi:hypothetical protein